MALVLVPPISFPTPPLLNAAVAPAYSSMTLDATLEKIGIVLVPPKTGNIRKVHFRTGIVNVGGSGPASKDVRIETVSTGGLPSGTLWGTNTNVSQGIDATDDNVWKTTAALTADAVITDATIPIAVVISNPVTDFGDWQVSTIGGAMNASARPYVLLYTTSWQKQSPHIPVLALEYSDGSIEPVEGMWPISGFSVQNVDSLSTPDEVGIKFRVKNRARLRGFWLFHQCLNTGATFEMVFYNASEVEDSSRAFDPLLMRAVSYQMFKESLAASFIIEPNTWYRLTYRPLTGTDSNISYMECASTALMNAMPGGPDCYWTERTDAGTWTDNTTKVPLMGALFDQLSDDVQAGGASSAHWIGG